jgi:hypothetical protein
MAGVTFRTFRTDTQGFLRRVGEICASARCPRRTRTGNFSHYANRSQSKRTEATQCRWSEALRRFRAEAQPNGPRVVSLSKDFGTNCHVVQSPRRAQSPNFGNYGNRLQSERIERKPCSSREPWRRLRRQPPAAPANFGTNRHVSHRPRGAPRLHFGNSGHRLPSEGTYRKSAQPERARSAVKCGGAPLVWRWSVRMRPASVRGIGVRAKAAEHRRSPQPAAPDPSQPCAISSATGAPADPQPRRTPTVPRAAPSRAQRWKMVSRAFRHPSTAFHKTSAEGRNKLRYCERARASRASISPKCRWPPY